MSDQCKVFISSAYDNDLKPLRTDLAEELRNSGHVPLLFEENFGYWGEDTIEKCISKVMESDIMILLLTERSGSFTEKDDKVTATYVEFYQALKSGKLVIPFVKKDMAELYREQIKHFIKKEIDKFIESNGFEPEHTFDVMPAVREYMHEHQETLLSAFEKVDDYVWSFLYDVDQNSAWMYPIEIARSEDTYIAIKQYLSEFVKHGLFYIPLRNDLEENAKKSSLFLDYREFTLDLMSSIKNGSVDKDILLSKLIGRLEGGEVDNRDSPYFSKKLGEIEDCSGITLYKRRDDKMVCVSYDGSTTPTKEYALNDDSSFVVAAYNEDKANEILYFEENKSQLYMTRKVGEYVLTCHYKLVGDWNERKVEVYEKQLFSVIIDMRTRLYLDFVIKMIGGMENE